MKLVNHYDIPLIVAITNGSETHDVSVGAKGSTSIADGYSLTADVKEKYPRLKEIDDKPKTKAAEVAENKAEAPADAPAEAAPATADNSTLSLGGKRR